MTGRGRDDGRDRGGAEAPAAGRPSIPTDDEAWSPGSATRPILVLGVGNILLSDEGIGVRVVETFQAGYRVPATVEVLDGGTAGMDLLDVLAGRSHVIIVDAIRSERPPGSIVRLRGEAVPALFRTRISPHQLGLSEVLAALKLIDAEPAHLSLIGIVPEDLSTTLELSPRLAAAVPTLAAMIAEELAGFGFPVARTDTEPGAPPAPRA